MRILLVPLLALAAFTSPGARIEFRPREKSELTKEFETSISLSLDDLSIQMNGQDVDPGTVLGGFDMDAANMQASLAVAIHDTYVALGEGRPTELLREFQRVRAEYKDGTGESNSDDGEDLGLIGRSVRFVWKPDEGTYARTFEGGGGNEENLAALNEDMDLRDLIPEGAVEEGAEWRIAWSDHMGLILPGLDLEASRGMLTAKMEADTDEDAEVPRALLETLFDAIRKTLADASATCTNKGIREIDGRQMSVVEIQSAIDGTLDLSAFTDAVGDQFPEGVVVDRLDLDLSLDISGELLWDLAAGHFHSLELSGEIGGDMSLEVSVDMNEAKFAGSATAEYSGELSRTASVE